MKFSYPGLSDSAVLDSRKSYGANIITTQEVEGFYKKLISNLKDPIIVILMYLTEHSNSKETLLKKFEKDATKNNKS